MKTITLNGTEYTSTIEDKHICVIADCGWIFEGYEVQGEREGFLALRDANVVRSWSNGLGIGGLANPDHSDDYKLDGLGDISIADNAVIAVLDLRW